MFENQRISQLLSHIFGTRSLFVVAVLFLGDNLQAWQTLASTRLWSQNVIVPQCYRNGSQAAGTSYANDPKARLQISQIDVDIDICDQTSSTTLLIAIHNNSGVDQTAELLIPVHRGSVVRGFTFSGAEQKPSTELLESDAAKKIFQEIVAKLRDPALLEFAGYDMVRSSVFPVPAGGDQKIRLTLEQLLPSENQRVDYVLPRSQSLHSDVPWNISAHIRSASSIAALYSPTHQIAVQRISDRESKLSVPSQKAGPGAFRLSYLSSNGPLTASLMTSQEADGKSGQFLLLAGLADEVAPSKKTREAIRREITLVIDRSGSMSGEKLEQAKQAATQVISGLSKGEAFNVICFNSRVEQFSQQPTVKTAESAQQAIEYIQSIKAADGTNIHDALQIGLAPEVSEGCLPIVLFLTDGLPTVGNTSEAAIREIAEKHNPHQRRVFTFGVGFDVNTPLLDKLATLTRGFATFVTPGENVEVAVSKVFRGLSGPALSDVEIRIADQLDTQPPRIYDVLPSRLPDLYEGEQLIVLGNYRGDQPLKFLVTAKRGDQKLRFNFEFDPKEIKGQPFVARLWASRKIASLIDQVRDMGVEGTAAPQILTSNRSSSGTIATTAASTSPTKVVPRIVELTDSIIALSKRYGVLTEYTSFLATAGVDLSDTEKVKQTLGDNLVNRALNCRTGQASWNQEVNNGNLRGQTCLNLGNRYVDGSGNWVSSTSVVQCRDNSLYNRSGRWIEANLISQPEVQPDEQVEFGSPEFMLLVWKLVELGRQDELSVEGEIMITVEGKVVLVHGSEPAPKR